MPDDPKAAVPQGLRLLDDDETFEVTDEEIGLVAGLPDVRYTLRSITKAQIEALKTKHRGTKEWNKSTRQREYGDFNQAGYDADMLDLALVDWTGITRRGKPAPCDRENRQRLDPVRQQLIVTKATMNRVEDVAAPVEDAEADSFRAAD